MPNTINYAEIYSNQLRECCLTRKIQKIDTQNTKKNFLWVKKEPPEAIPRGLNYFIVKISEILHFKALQISFRSGNLTKSELLLHRSQMVEGESRYIGVVIGSVPSALVATGIL